MADTRPRFNHGLKPVAFCEGRVKKKARNQKIKDSKK